jgi:hypothetical protein
MREACSLTWAALVRLFRSRASLVAEILVLRHQINIQRPHLPKRLAIGAVVLTSREHIIALEPLEKGLMGTLLRYPYEVRDEKEYFDEIQDVKVTKDMLDLAKHIVSQKAADFEPEKFEDHYEGALVELINAKRNGRTISAKPRPKTDKVVNLMDALKKSIASADPKRQEAPQGGGRSERDVVANRRKETRGEKSCKTGTGHRAPQSRLVYGLT